MILRESQWIWFLCISNFLVSPRTVHSSYRGGIIQWKPVDPGEFNGRIQIIHHIAWRGDSGQGGGCIDSTTGEGGQLIGTGAGELLCRVGCSGTVGPVTSFCNDISTVDNWSAGQRTYEYDLNVNLSYFEASYTDRGFITLFGLSLGWQLRVGGNLLHRVDTGLVNTPPVSGMLPVVRLQEGCNQTIRIPVEDIDGDYVQCRWAESMQGECDDLCSLLLPGSLNASTCELHHLATSGPGAYFVALQIEDFTSAADTTQPLSSIPLHFVALITSSPLSCTDRPRFVGTTRVDGSCIGVPFNTTWSEPIIARTISGNTSIVEITIASPLGMEKSELLPTSNAMEWHVTTTWTPTTSLQYGPNILCYMAIDSRNLSTAPACITLLGGVAAPLPVLNSMTPMGEIFPNHREWSVEFNKQFIRSPRARYIRIYEEGAGEEVVSINVKDSTAVDYPGSDGRTLKFYTNFTFSVNHTYYVLMDPGVAVGTEFCNAESPALRDKTAWVVTVKDERPLILTCTFGDIRLVGGSAAYEGRVELCNDNSEWGTVCDDGWSESDASVACKQAGFQLNDVMVTATIGANFGEGTGLILLDDLRCTGEESNLFDCAHRGIGRHNCRHTEDAGVICKTCEEGELRLAGGHSVTNGRVEVCIEKRWGTVCGDSWDNMEVEVICRQLGYLEPGAKRSYFGERSGPVNLYDLECTGTENSFTECANKPVASNCSLPDVGVFCTVCTDGDVRLVGGASVSEGRVEVCYQYQWTTICDRGWDNNDASVVCGQLGFSLQGAVAVGNAAFGEGAGLVLTERVSCFGREDSILNCPHVGIKLHTCTHLQDAGVVCQFCEDGEVRLVGGGSDLTVGQVEVCLNKTWGTVCGDSWDETDARVVCSQLGYINTNASVVSNFSQVSGLTIAARLECSGDESSLLECPFELDASNCSHSHVAGVKCYVCLDGDIRLVGGSTANEGRVELCYNNQWGTVCDDGWDNSDASVACKQAGYSLTDVTALATVGGSFGRGMGMILLDDTRCTGDESRLFDCSSRGIGIHNCGHSEDAGIICKFCEDGDVRLIEGSTSTNGIVEVCIAKVWGTVCADSWDLSDAQVVCRQLGYLEPSSMIVPSHNFQQSDRVTIISSLECTGEEHNILDCVYDLMMSQCRNESAAVQCIVCSDGDIRLVGGSVASEGRVEVCYSNQWGTVCDIGWDDNDASVACGQAGFSLTGAIARGRAMFGQGSGPIFLERVACLGREDSLLNCSHTGVGVQSCNHHQDAGVICQFCEDGEVRLIGGGSDSTIGQVEVCMNKTWGTVCGDSWDETDAGVVCSQLGYLGTNALPVSIAHYSHGSGSIFITRVECNGDERSILECGHDLHPPRCSHSEDAGVRCTVCLEGDIRLVGGSIANEGRVELCYSNQWGTVCDDGWDNNDASVACKQAGFSSSSKIKNAAVGHSGLFGRGVGHILLDEVTCTGRESSLFNCPNRGIGIHNCGHHEDAGVICTALEPFTLTFVNNTPRVEDNHISVDFITSRPMSFASCLLRNDQLKVNKNCTSGGVQFAGLSSGYYIFRIEARDRELVAERLVIRRLLEVVEIPFTLTFVNNTPHVEGNCVSISFIASKPVYSATCYLGRSLRKNCTTGGVEFTNVRSASYAFRVVAIDKERFGHKTVERRIIHVLGEGSSSCAVHLMNEGIFINGGNVSIYFVGIGPVESYFCRIDRSPFLPCSSPVEYNNLEHGIHTVRVKSQKCGENDKRLSFKITV